MFEKNALIVAVPLLQLAEREFPKLMRHRTNRQDALQVLRMVQWQARGVNVADAARKELAQLEIDLGLRLPEVDVARMAA